MMNIKAIYKICSKRRGRAKWKLSVNVNLLVKEKNRIIERVPVRLVYILNRANTKEWICLLSTDADMDEEQIIRQYGKRWNIETMFKCCKQYLKLGKDFQSPSFETQNAQLAIALARYMLVAVEQRESEDYRSCGELFLLYYPGSGTFSYKSNRLNCPCVMLSLQIPNYHTILVELDTDNSLFHLRYSQFSHLLLLCHPVLVYAALTELFDTHYPNWL